MKQGNNRGRGPTTPVPSGYQLIRQDKRYYPAKIRTDANGKQIGNSYYRKNGETVSYFVRMQALAFLLARYAEDKGDLSPDETVQLTN